MKEFSIKIKLIDYISITLNMNKLEFVNKLSAITDAEKSSIFSSAFDSFSSSNNEYKGQITSDTFQLKRRRRAFDTNYNLSCAKGTFTEQNGQLTIETEINGLDKSMLIFVAPVIIIYAIIISALTSSHNKGDLLVIPLLIVQGAFMLLLFYLFMKRSVARMKYDFERELYFLTKK